MSHSPANPGEMEQARSRGSIYRQQLKRLNTLIDRGGSLSGNERNCVFLNMGSSGGQVQFATASTVTGLDQPDDSRCYGLTDWDRDGDVDLWVMNRTAPRVRVMLNEQATTNHFLSLKLVGRTCNLDAIGARVEVRCVDSEKSPVLSKSLRAGEGFLSQSTKWLHFGLGASAGISDVVVHWPGGTSERYTGFEVDGHYRLVQGEGTPHKLLPSPISFQVKPPSKDSRNVAASEQAEVFLASRLPVPRLPLKTMNGEAKRLDQIAEFPMLLNLWASWCVPCRQELRDLAAHAQELRRAGVTVVALSVDGLAGSDQLDTVSLSKYIDALDLPFFVGLATEETRLRLQFMDDLLFGQKRDLPVPVSFLLDQNGRLAAIYRGPMKLSTLDIHSSQLDLIDRSLYEAALPFAGRWHRPQGLATPLGLPISLYQRQQLGDAAHYLLQHRATLALQTEFAPFATQLASRLGPDLRPEAMELYRASLEKDPDSVAALNNLAWNLVREDTPDKKQVAEALRFANRAADLTDYGVVAVLHTLARTQHLAGQKTTCLRTLKQAMAIAQRDRDQEKIDQIQLMIQKVSTSG